MKEKPKKPPESATFVNTEMNLFDNVFGENRFLKICLFIIIVLGVSLYSKVSDIENGYRAVIQWPGSEEESEIDGNNASQRYIMLASEFFSATYFGATPSTVERQYSAIMQFVHPTQHGVMQKRLDSKAEQLKNLRTASIYGDVDWSRGFRQERVRDNDEYGALRNVYRVRFDISRSIYFGASNEPSDVEHKTMAIDYVIEHGRFWLLNLKVEDRGENR